MTHKNKWGVVVGRPKMAAWKNSPTDPNLNNVGIICPYAEFPTRREARQAAKGSTRSNPWWHYHAQKMSS